MLLSQKKFVKFLQDLVLYRKGFFLEIYFCLYSSGSGRFGVNPCTVFHVAVRATADGGAGLAGDPKLNIFTEQLLQIAHLAGDPKRKG